MNKMSIEERVEHLRWYGYNPIHLWGKVYLVRYRPVGSSDWPFYTIMVFKD
jgi:hypothetical protein